MSEPISADQIVKKNSNEFSFVKEVINEVNNSDFKTGVADFYKMLSGDKHVDNSDTYIWTALSAIGDDIGEVIYQNVLNYMQNVTDIDTCSIKSLQSMISLLGAKYTVLDGVDKLPLEVYKQLEIFSMRRECLLDSRIVQQKLVDALSDVQEAPIEEQLRTISTLNEYRASLSGQLSDLPFGADETSVSLSPKIDVSALDNFISSTYFSTISHYLMLTYDKSSEDKPIFEELSSSILLSGFVLPNKYADKMDSYKVKWNIPREFDPEAEMKKIEDGVSAYDNYTLREQELLDMEKKRESDPKVELEPLTRYAFFKEAKVREYFQFVEDWYSSQLDYYSQAKSYEVDETYVDVTYERYDARPQLLDDDGKNLKWYQVVKVVESLLDLTHKLQDIREYLKSHAQRTYMKGTFLLLSYLINEHLKQNVYPVMNSMQAAPGSLSNVLAPGAQAISVDDNGISTYQSSAIITVETKPIEYDSNDVALKLIEYVDQTQYFNIATDNREDKLSMEDIHSSGAVHQSLNGKFWENDGTTAGSPTYIDSTSFLRNQDASKLVTSRTFQLEQIADFYSNILGASKDKSYMLSDKNEYVDGFLKAVFASGADDSWWNDAYQKVMATLSDQTRTVDVEDYLSSLSSAYDSAQFVLSDYQQTPNTTIQQQIEEAKQQYIDRLSAACNDYDADVTSYLQGCLDEIDGLLEGLAEIKDDFDNIDIAAQTLYAANAAYTSSYNPNGQYVLENADAYMTHIRNRVDAVPNALYSSLIAQTDSILANLRLVTANLTSYCSSHSYTLSVKYKSLSINNETLELTPLKDCIQIVTGQLTYTQSRYFEKIYQEVVNKLNAKKIELLQQIEDLKAFIRELMATTIKNPDIESFSVLSGLLKSKNYLLETFSLTSCVDAVSAILDYSKDPWYQYKKSLFLKYTGQEVGETPYYYLDNSVHPSYQIHPCLSNFIEKVDFSYPIKNLGGVADTILKQQIQQLVDLSSEYITEDGYLKDAWKNPLIANIDYSVRYEQADHTDANLSANPYFGWDGFIHPKVFQACIDTTLGFNAISADVFSGQNMTLNELADLQTQFSAFKAALRLAKDNDGGIETYDIKQYGLDWYGNSYILLQKEGGKLDGTLWFRRKNCPFPSLAFAAEKVEIEADSTTTEEYFWSKAAGISYSSGQSNTKWLDAIKKGDFIKLNNSIYVPKFRDFTFSHDKTILLAEVDNSNSRPQVVHGIIKQEKLKSHDYSGIRTYFCQDRESRKEFLDTSILTASDWWFASWFSQDSTMGAVYVDDHDLNSPVSAAVFKYYKNDTSQHAVMSAEFLPEGRSAPVVVDCTLDGTLTFAYTVSGTPVSDILSDSLHPSDQISIALSSSPSWNVETQKFYSIGDSLLKAEKMQFKPMMPPGFIVATSSTTLSDNAYNSWRVDENERKANGILKFELSVPQMAENAGIDFRYVCPMRMVEGYMSAITSSDSSYHYSTDTGYVKLSGVVENYNDVHFFESVYNQYVADETDEQYYELTDPERIARKHPDKSKQAGQFDYIQLAHYDVMKHLSAMKSEEDLDDSLTSNQALPESWKHSGMLQPFMMVNDAIPDTYISGFYVSKSDGNQDAFRTDRTDAISTAAHAVITLDQDQQISVSWLSTQNGIKLDFNSKYYLSSGIYDLLNSVSSENVSEIMPITPPDLITAQLQRNKQNMFLNLDKPGEAGLLNIWRAGTRPLQDEYGKESMTMFKQSTWLIKNISDSKPKFIIAKAEVPTADTAPIVAGIEARTSISYSAASKQDIDATTMLIATEDLDGRLIVFE